jgi:hypothetical protein
MTSSRYLWKPEKNEWLKEERDICFEELVDAIANGLVVGLKKYEGTKLIHRGQVVIVLNLNGEIWHVPATVNELSVLLRTAYKK